jgi:hypothetical protein
MESSGMEKWFGVFFDTATSKASEIVLHKVALLNFY